MTKRNGRELSFNFLSLSVLFLFRLGHKVLDSNNLKPNCWKLAGARHFPTSTFRPWDWLSSKSSSSIPPSFLLQAWAFPVRLRLRVPQSGPLCERFTDAQDTNGGAGTARKECFSWDIPGMASGGQILSHKPWCWDRVEGERGKQLIMLAGILVWPSAPKDFNDPFVTFSSSSGKETVANHLC